MAEPASTSRTVPPPRSPPAESPSTRAAAASPPRNATAPPPTTGSTMPKAATATTARYDPAFTASVSGEASTLRETVCITRPATPSATPTSTPAASRGIREATSTAAAWSSDPPKRRPSSSGRPTFAEPCVTCTAASSVAPTRPRAMRRAAPRRGFAGPPGACTSASAWSGSKRGDDGIDVVVHRRGTAEHPDAVGQAVHLAALHEGQRLPDGVAGELDLVRVGVPVRDVEELDVADGGEALDVGRAEPVVGVALARPGVLEAELLGDGRQQRAL